jgi:TPR repeat protein
MQKRWLVLFLLFHSLVQANTLDEAKLKVQQKDFAAARAIYLDLANAGDAKACFNLGLMYHDGDGVQQNIEEAVNWYKKSAQLNYKEAQYILASLVFNREIQSVSYADAVQYYQQAAELGHVKSQLNLGMLYYRGDVITQDLNASFKWLSLAASNNNSEAQGYLANLYMQGIGVAQDVVKAAMWLMLATQNEDNRFINKHTKILNYTTSQMSPEQIEAAIKMSKNCKSQSFKSCLH